MRKRLGELLNELYHQARTDTEKHEAVRNLMNALTSGVSEEEAVEFVRVLVRFLYEHWYYKELVSDLEVVLSDFQSAFAFFEKQKRSFEEEWEILDKMDLTN